MVKITDSDTAPNVFLHGMHKSAFPIAVAHKEGRASFKAASDESASDLVRSGRVPVRYVDNGSLEPTESYPANPNGSPAGIAAVSSSDGRYVYILSLCSGSRFVNRYPRVLSIMPHPERSTLFASWVPDGKKEDWGDTLPWQRLFYSARRWVSI